MYRYLLIAAFTAAAMSFGALGALAHGDATGVVKERMDLMKTVGDAMKSLTEMMRGKRDYDADRVRAAAREIADHGGEALTRLFPTDSLDGPTEALPAIWTDWERFSALADQVTGYATALHAAAGNERVRAGGGMMMGGGAAMMGGTRMMSAEVLATMPPDAAFQHLADTCSSCHQDFRKEKP
mgnify:CR=1 FL=1